MPKISKQILAVVFSALIILSVYAGSYLPLMKSRSFIWTMRNDLGNVKSFTDFKTVVSAYLDMPSPIGQEELVRQTANTVMKMIAQGNVRPEMISPLIDYLWSYYQPIINRNKGMSFGQNLFIMGNINEIAFLTTKEQKFFLASKSFFEKGMELGPKRPQFLYGLFDIYRFEGNIERLKEIKEQILSQWPTDKKIQEFFDKFIAGQSAVKNQ